MLEFSAVRAAIDEGIRRGLHTGVQIYVSVNGRVLLDAGFGEAAPGCPLTSDHLMPWRSAGKPLTALLVLKQLQHRGISPDATLGELLPAAAGTDKSGVSIRSLLMHTSGFPVSDTGWPEANWSESVSRVLRAACELPMGTAAYHPQSSWFLLGELLRELSGDGVPFPELITRELLQPLGLYEVYCGIPETRLEDLASHLPTLYERDRGTLVVSAWSGGPWLTRCSPGSSFRGPVRQLGRFMELLLAGGRMADGTEYAPESVVRSMTTRQRAGQYDQTLQHVVDFGLGLICDSKRYGAETVPYGFGRWSSGSCYGHGGSQCALAMCDPERGLAVAWSANGFCGEGQHQRRNRLIQDGLYKDLGFTEEGGV
ncbi:MAG: Esterase EstB [Planctomycetota bacterium]|jgi:CubicO group peptidase (beta-lactamase class C family)